MGVKDTIVDFALANVKHGGSWWMPLLLIVISCLNSLTAGTLVWCLGVMQALLSLIINFSNGKVGIVLAPFCLACGTAVATYMYMEMMRNGGADALLEKTGTKDSKWLGQAKEFASSYGIAGLLFIQVCPLTPAPTAVLVVAGMLVQMNETALFTTLVGAKFLLLLLGAVATRYAAEGKDLETLILEQSGRRPVEGSGEEKAEEPKKDK
mmetsp:Transcript_99686/g.157788  ORF Transcript_99686/g.157788 Transcript_99686/m.157788 type:complete len:209 (-) Transcript_99686:51-677(-)